jgi:RNA polymerase sigma-70 factor (family 1)
MLLDALFKQYYRPLCLYAAHYLNGDIVASEDIVQDCFVKLWQRDDSDRRNITDKRNISDKRAFLYTAVRNACIDTLRRQHPEMTSIDPSDLEGTISDEEAVDRSEREAKVWEIINGLPDRCREVFLMAKRDGMTYNEIAEELDISVKTVEHQISKAMKKLKSSRGLQFVLMVI